MADTGDDDHAGEPPSGACSPTNVVNLGREMQVAIAEGLRRYYQHIVDEGVPEHLMRILEAGLGPAEQRVKRDDEKRDHSADIPTQPNAD